MTPPAGAVHGVARGAMWILLNIVLTTGCSFFLMGFALRRIGLVDFGLYAIISSFTDLLTVADYGLGMGLVRSMAIQSSGTGDEQQAARADIEAGHSAFLVLAGLVVLATTAIALALPAIVRVPDQHRGAVTLGVVIAGAGAALGLATASAPALATGYRNFRLVSLASAAGLVVRTGIVVTLGPSLRLVALAMAVSVGALTERIVLVVWVRRRIPWFRLRPRRASFRAIRRVLFFAIPALIFSVTAQLITAVDTVVIGAFVGAASVAVYRVGLTLPVQAVGVLYQGFSAAFPSLAGTRDRREQEHAMRFLGKVLSFAAGIGFALMVCFRSDLVSLLLGHGSELATTVLIVFSCALALDAAVHCPASVMIARGRHARVAVFSPLELAINVALTVVLVLVMGPVGAAVGTLIATVVVDLIVFPFIVDRELDTAPIRVMVVDGLIPLAAGAAITTGSASLLWAVPAAPLRFVLTAGLAVSAGSLAGSLALGAAGRRLFRSAFARSNP